MVVIQPNINWGVQKEKLMEVKENWLSRTMAQSEQVWVGTPVFTGSMYQHQDVKTKMEELI
jgi:hypothetical protein